jgi:hypothetical protein
MRLFKDATSGGRNCPQVIGTRSKVAFNVKNFDKFYKFS